MESKVILLAEDNPDDAFVFRMMCRRAALPHTLHIVDDGQQAIDWLCGKEKYADREKFPMPDLVLLDLKMPVKNGFDVLEWLRAQKDLQTLDVTVLSSSDDPRDVKRADALGVKKFFVKSASLQDVIQYLRSI